MHRVIALGSNNLVPATTRTNSDFSRHCNHLRTYFHNVRGQSQLSASEALTTLMLSETLSTGFARMAVDRKKMVWMSGLFAVGLIGFAGYEFYKTVMEMSVGAKEIAEAIMPHELGQTLLETGDFTTYQTLYSEIDNALVAHAKEYGLHVYNPDIPPADWVEAFRRRFGGVLPLIHFGARNKPLLVATGVSLALAAASFWRSHRVSQIGSHLNAAARLAETFASRHQGGLKSEYYQSHTFSTDSRGVSDPSIYYDAIDTGPDPQLALNTNDIAHISNALDHFFARRFLPVLTDNPLSREVPGSETEPRRTGPKVKTRPAPTTQPQVQASDQTPVSELTAHTKMFLGKKHNPFGEIRHAFVINTRLAVFVTVPRSDWDSAFPDNAQVHSAARALNKGFVTRAHGQEGIKRVGDRYELKILSQTTGQNRNLSGVMSPQVTKAGPVTILHLTLHHDKSAGRWFHRKY